MYLFFDPGFMNLVGFASGTKWQFPRETGGFSEDDLILAAAIARLHRWPVSFDEPALPRNARRSHGAPATAIPPTRHGGRPKLCPPTS